MDQFLSVKLIAHALLPPASMVLGLLLAVVFMVLGARRLAGVVAVVAVLELAVLSLPTVADALVEPLEKQARDAHKLAPACCYSAIVVLGGGITQASPPSMPVADLNDAADRIRYAAQLFHSNVAPRIVVSGGEVRSHPPPGAETEADAMQALLVEFGVPQTAIVKEGKSRSTGENMAELRRIVGDSAVALVTSAYHMPRALRLAAQLNLKASAFPTDYRVPAPARPLWQNVLPSIEALNTANYALWEYLALVFDRRDFKPS
jgi:uncharacterized SAM-binding protein YcdF (DUF218 family)